MKHPIKFIFAFVILLSFITCEKEDQIFSDAPSESAEYKIHSAEDFDLPKFFTPGRDGGKSPFHFITSQTKVDPFTSGSPQDAYNILLLDSTTYKRVSEPKANAWDGEFDKYDISYYFKDTVYSYYNEYAPAYAGNLYTYKPPVFSAITPFASTNPNKTIKLVRNSRFENYIDIDCGKQKRRYLYLHYFNGVLVGTNTVDGDRCNSNIFSFKHIL